MRAGLDARAAAIVMRSVRNTVNTGRTVVCTIHQPSIDIFEACQALPPPSVSLATPFSASDWMSVPPCLPCDFSRYSQLCAREVPIYAGIR